jgi:DNA repair photolyase
MGYSMNPYQGCEHGCVYCYARNTHPYWGYSAGIDFEAVILVKKNAPALLHKRLVSKKWDGSPIMMSGNTDCYQPVERKMQLTRRMLEVMERFGNPVGLVTKSQLILRDLDILERLAAKRLVRAAISLNTLDEDFRRVLEPRAASVESRLKTIRSLRAAGIPVHVLAAPIIPGLNDHEVFDLVKAAGEAGANGASYIVARLNGDVARIFEDWLEKYYPERRDKVMGRIAEVHGGQVNDSRFNLRMKGEGKYADHLSDQFRLARKKFLPEEEDIGFDRHLYSQLKQPQLSLF